MDLPNLDTSRLPAGYLDEVLAFAERRGLKDQLLEQFDHLGHDQDEHRRAMKATLFTDWAPYSFAFQWYTQDRNGDWQPWINGGLIYYGPGDSGVGAPQFSVRLGETKEGWEVHT